MQFCDLISICDAYNAIFCYSINVLLFPCMKSMCCYGVHQNAYCLQNYPVTMAFLQRTAKLSAQLIFINEMKQVCQGAQHYHLNKGGKEAGN